MSNQFSKNKLNKPVQLERTKEQHMKVQTEMVK